LIRRNSGNDGNSSDRFGVRDPGAAEQNDDS